ncbi:MAG: hypothetical protein DSZ03_07580, partial [Sulfurimonas sp.]
MKKTFLFLLILPGIFFIACAPKVVEVKPNIVFPSYPDEPKIIYLDTYRGGVSVEEDKGLNDVIDVFLGEDNDDSGVSN